MRRGCCCLFSSRNRPPGLWELDFLVQTPELPKRVPQLASLRRLPLQSTQDPPRLTQKLGLLGSLYRRRDYRAMEHLFEAIPQLQRRPAAVNWMIRAYCAQYEFTVAMAVLIEFSDIVSTSAVCQFLRRIARTSRNASAAEDIWRRFGERGPEVAANTLLCLRALGDDARYEYILRHSRSRWGAQATELVQVAVFDAVLSENWDEALAHSRKLLSRPHNRARNAYMWAADELGRTARWDALQALTTLMSSDLNFTIGPQFTEFAIQQIPRQYPEVLPHEWLKKCTALGWPIGAGSVSRMLKELAVRFPHRLQDIEAARRGIQTPSLGFGPGSGDPSLALMRRRPADCVAILDDMVRRGIRPSYFHCVWAFEALCRRDHETLPALIQRITDWGYSKHCAGIDLAVAEAEYRKHATSEKALPLCYELIATFLSEYPLVQHDRIHLTRLAEMLLSAGDATSSGRILDHLRQTQSPGLRYTARTHDSASLSLSLRSRLAENAPITPYMDEILSDRPLILLDAKFRRVLRQALKRRGESSIIMTRVEAHNTWVDREISSEIQRIMQFSPA